MLDNKESFEYFCLLCDECHHFQIGVCEMVGDLGHINGAVFS